MLCVKHICFSNNSLIQPHIVGIAVILVEASHSPLAACLLIFLFATPAHRLQRICNGFYIAFVHHEACFRSHRLRTATSAICHHWSAARHCLKVGRWKIILIFLFATPAHRLQRDKECKSCCITRIRIIIIYSRL